MLPFENAKLLPKSKVFEEQVAARAKEASGHDRQKPQQAHHETSFTRVHAKAGTQPTYLIRQQIAILASHNQILSAFILAVGVLQINCFADPASLSERRPAIINPLKLGGWPS